MLPLKCKSISVSLPEVLQQTVDYWGHPDIKVMIHVSRCLAALAAICDTTRHKQGPVLPASVAHLMEPRWTLCWLVERWLFPGHITPTRMVEWQARVDFLANKEIGSK